LWELPAEAVLDVEIVERRWVSKKTCPQLAVRRATAQGESTSHLRIEDIESWRDRLQAIIQPQGDAEAEEGDRELLPKAGRPYVRTPPPKRFAK